MVEAAPQGEAFPTGENGGTRNGLVCARYTGRVTVTPALTKIGLTRSERWSWVPGMDSNHDYHKPRGMCNLQILKAEIAQKGTKYPYRYSTGTVRP